MEQEDQNQSKPRKLLPSELFDAWAIQGKDEEFALGDETARQFLLEDLQPLLSNISESKFTFLELGCASGWATRVVGSMDKCERAVGIDISPKMIWKAKNWFTNPPNTSYYDTDLLSFELKDTKFDVVFSFACLYYVIPMERIAEKIKDWLKPGGVFIAGTDYYTENTVTHYWSSMMNIDMDLRSKEEWKSLFETFGLQNVNQIVKRYSNSTDEEQGSIFTFGFMNSNSKSSKLQNDVSEHE